LVWTMMYSIIQLHFVGYKWRPEWVQISCGICTPADQLDRFPAVDQSVSWIPVPILFCFAYFCHAFAVNKNVREIRPNRHNNLACWIINLLLDVLLCSIAENFYSLFVFWRACRAQLVKILGDTTQQNV